MARQLAKGAAFLAVLLGVGLATAHAGTASKSVQFVADEGIGGVGWDSGWRGVWPIYVRLDFGIGGDHIYAKLPGTGQVTWPSPSIKFTGTSGAGQLKMDGGAGFSCKGKLDLPFPGFPVEFNVPYVPNFDLRWNETKTFTPFLLDSAATVSDTFGGGTILDVDLTDLILPIPGIGGGITVGASGQMSASFAGDSIYVSGAGSIYSEGASKTVSLSGSYYQPTVKYYETLNRTVSLVASPGVYVEFLIFRWELPVFNINIPIISGTQNLNFNNETPRFGLPNISTSTSTVDFGTVTVGQSKDRTFTLSNTGEATLNVASLTESSLHFSKVSPSTPFSISPGNSRTVTVRFTPQSTGSKSTALSIYSDDPDEPTKTVQLTGVGLPASTRIIRLVGDLAFGNVRVGQTATRMLTICNDGNSTLTVSGITYPSGFSGAWSGTIAA
ncbi:MAG TPA: choice-of-anchor D domain-containing protein, partial [Anaerolineales bacterium]|nr:choice-of-anchor D domain-containing protein [Anaerolineales bacterium]